MEEAANSVVPYLEVAAELEGQRAPTVALSTAEHVERVLIDALPELVGVEHVARRLGMSRRTLARRLQDENTGFREIQDRARRQLAERLICDPAVPLSEIAWQVGYSSKTSFHRAFLRWFGAAPGHYRKQRLAEPGLNQ